ncbi:hypothetical protein IAT38_002820 [Cryptococcus sp. DSM 104549]
MSAFPAALKPAARSAYRDVLRAARITFQGDPTRHIAMLNTVRATFLSPTLTPPQATPPTSDGTPDVQTATEEDLAKRINDWKDVARFLRQNVVQGEQTPEGNWKLRVTPDTELGDNASIRSPPVLPTTPFPNRNKRRRCSDVAAETKQAS